MHHNSRTNIIFSDAYILDMPLETLNGVISGHADSTFCNSFSTSFVHLFSPIRYIMLNYSHLQYARSREISYFLITIRTLGKYHSDRVCCLAFIWRYPITPEATI